jgi:hypothetical protein
MRTCIAIALVICLFGCGNEGDNPASFRIADSTVHLAGYSGMGSYWKNGIRTPLNFSPIQSMSVEGPTVAIGGTSSGLNIIWQNGNEVILEGSNGGVTLVAIRGANTFAVGYKSRTGWLLYKNGIRSNIEYTGWATGLGIIGDDAYIAGNRQGSEHQWHVSPFYHLDTYALMWKNEKEIFRETVNSYANTIFIHENDIYLGGHLNQYPSLKKVACYWKNGERVRLAPDDQDAQVLSLFINNDHVYAAGEKDGEAVYWVDGHIINLSTSSGSSKANSIYVLGDDVYVAGMEDQRGAVWKNGLKQFIPEQHTVGEIKFIAVTSNWSDQPKR